MMKRFLLAFLFACSAVLGQTSNLQNSDGDLQFSEEDMMMLQMLMMNDLFRETFVQSCTIESIEWLGASWAEKTCACAYDNLAKNRDLLLRFLKEEENANESEMEKMSFELLNPCLPNQFPPEMESSIIKECMNGGVRKSTCDCVVKGIKKKYTVKSFMKNVLENPKGLEQDITRITEKCD